jgi:hypothetical protein
MKHVKKTQAKKKVKRKIKNSHPPYLLQDLLIWRKRCDRFNENKNGIIPLKKYYYNNNDNGISLGFKYTSQILKSI